MTDGADSVRLGTGEATTPEAWIRMLTDDERERAAWRLREFRKGM